MPMELINVKQLSAMLSVKPKTIYDWVRRSEIPFFRIGALIRFDPERIKKWLMDKSEEPKQFRYSTK
jgi:excisionase family DNA binding protein